MRVSLSNLGRSVSLSHDKYSPCTKCETSIAQIWTGRTRHTKGRLQFLLVSTTVIARLLNVYLYQAPHTKRAWLLYVMFDQK